MSMDIYSRPGTRVVYANPRAGYAGDRESAGLYLSSDQVYTVASMDVGQSHTRVRLKEFPEITFNSVLFEVAP